LENLFRYIEVSNDPPLIKAAIAHVQFETIHPFRDGNGRIGRLLVTLLLCREKLLNEPLVYLSLYLRQNRAEYYNQLQVVRLRGDWESWIIFFLRGVSVVAEHAYELTTQIRKLFEQDTQRIRSDGQRKLASLLELHRIAKKSPLFTIAKAEKVLDQSISKPTLYSAAEKLCEMGILISSLNEKGTRVFFYQKYLDLLYE
jgi:Fic family protein